MVLRIANGTNSPRYENGAIQYRIHTSSYWRFTVTVARLVNATKSPLTKSWSNYSSQKDTKQLISVLAQSCVLCFFDATKAFDRFNYVKLFRILVERGLPPYIITVLINMCCVILGLSRDALYWKMKMYFTQQACVSWAGIASAYFPVFIGVRQGGVLSPLLFCVYILTTCCWDCPTLVLVII